MATSLSSCAYDPKKITPYFIDTKEQTCRKYVVTETEPEIVFKFDSELPIASCNGFISLPVDQAQDIKRHYEEWAKKKNKAAEVESIRPYAGHVDQELFILNGGN